MDSSSGDDPEHGFDDAIGGLFVAEVTVEDGDQPRLQQAPPAPPQVVEPVPVTPAASSTTAGPSVATAPPAAPVRPNLTTPAGLSNARSVLQQALSSTASSGQGVSSASATSTGGTATSATASSTQVSTVDPGQPSVVASGLSSGSGLGPLSGQGGQAPPASTAAVPSSTGVNLGQGVAATQQSRVTWANPTGGSLARPSLPPYPPGQLASNLPGTSSTVTVTGTVAPSSGMGQPYQPPQPQGSGVGQPVDANLIQAQIAQLQAQLAAAQLGTHGQGQVPSGQPNQVTPAVSVGPGASAPTNLPTYGKLPGTEPSTPGYPASQGLVTPGYYPPTTPSSRTPRTAIAAYGGYTLDNLQGTPSFGLGNPFFQPVGWTQAALLPQTLQDQANAGQSTPAVAGSTMPGAVQPQPESGRGYGQGEFGMPSNIKNAVRMIQPFYSDGSTVEKAQSFWDSFERATLGLSDTVRLSAFRECLKGKTGENWWMYSQIQDFETLRRRFHNQFICQTPLQMIERLKSTKRVRGMSAEVWGDQISSLCDAAQCYDPQMRYQYFLSGLRNREWKAALTTTMVTTIPQAVMVLLYKNMHIPVEDDADFAEEVAPKAASENALMQQMLNMMQQTQNLLVQQQQQMTRAPQSPNRNGQQGFTSAAYEDPLLSICAATENDPSKTGTGRRMGPDDYTREGISVCGRCHYKGCRRDVCRYNNMTCNNCRERGHVAFECDQPRRQGGPRPTGGNGNQSTGSRGCFFCSKPDHRIADCPVRRTVLQMADSSNAGAAPVQGQAQAQN